jgi:hypothetical protein
MYYAYVRARMYIQCRQIVKCTVINMHVNVFVHTHKYINSNICMQAQVYLAVTKWIKSQPNNAVAAEQVLSHVKFPCSKSLYKLIALQYVTIQAYCPAVRHYTTEQSKLLSRQLYVATLAKLPFFCCNTAPLP